LGLDRFDLVANDTGGAVAQIVAAHAGERLSTLTLTNCDTEGNTPPLLFKPVTVMARLGLLPKLGPYVAARRGRVRQVLAIGYQHRPACLTRWSTPTAIRSWGHQIPRAL
jgi:pimeloyl-ACP methyl ester carboxylesterase